MLFSLAIIFLLGLMLGSIFKKLKLPSILGMLFTGIILSPHLFNLLDTSILMISPDLRKLALVIILTRAGLSLDLKELKEVGRPAIFLCFVPALFEIAAITLFAPLLLKISYLEALLIGSILAAVSPAVVVPRMLKIKEENYGTNKNIPQMILAGASIDDIFVITIFTSVSAVIGGGVLSISSIAAIPISIVSGVIIGFFVGIVLSILFRSIAMRDSVKVLVLLSLSLLLITMEDYLSGKFAFSALLAIMFIGITLYKKDEKRAANLSTKYSKLWVGAEILLFVLVGAEVDLSYALAAGTKAILLILLALIFRSVGVFVSLIGTNLNLKERMFCIIAYLPKATVQAAIGAIPLTLGYECGPIALTMAVLSILITAPLGAIGMDLFYKKLLTESEQT